MSNRTVLVAKPSLANVTHVWLDIRVGHLVASQTLSCLEGCVAHSALVGFVSTVNLHMACQALFQEKCLFTHATPVPFHTRGVNQLVSGKTFGMTENLVTSFATERPFASVGHHVGFQCGL